MTQKESILHQFPSILKRIRDRYLENSFPIHGYWEFEFLNFKNTVNGHVVGIFNQISKIYLDSDIDFFQSIQIFSWVNCPVNLLKTS